MKQVNPLIRKTIQKLVNDIIPFSLEPLNISGDEAIKTLDEIRRHINTIKFLNNQNYPAHPTATYVLLKKIMSNIEEATIPDPGSTRTTRINKKGPGNTQVAKTPQNAAESKIGRF